MSVKDNLPLRLHHQTLGDGPPLVIIHGLLGSGDNWLTHARTLAERFRVVLVDQRNHGRSPHHEVMDYPAMAGDLLALMDELGLEQADLLGHSMGGKAAMRVALDHPERVNRLIVADIAPKAYPTRHKVLLDTLSEINLPDHPSRTSVSDSLAPRIPDLGVRQFLLKNLDTDSDGSLRWRIGLENIRASYDHICAEITSDHPFTGPTSFIDAERSEYVQPGDRGGILRLFPATEFATVPKAGHWLHADNPQGFLELLNQFLR